MFKILGFRAKKLGFFLIFGLIFITVSTIYYQNVEDEKFNYFMEIESRRTLGLILDTPNCKILNISAWDSSIKALIYPYKKINCDQKNRHWTHVDQTNLVLNSSAIIESGFSFESISCYYSPFWRIEQTYETFTTDADNLVRISDKTFTLVSLVSQITDENIRVSCISKYWPYFGSIVYRNFHTFVQPGASSKTLEKISKWSKIQKKVGNSNSNSRPPNIVLLGLDSISRLSLVRNLPKTRAVLARMGAIEYLGYTKVGENTFPNQMPFLTGYSEEDVGKFCYFDRWKPLDHCPYIWRDFDKVGYLTASVEDAPYLGAFNYFKTGFVRKPTDFYYRTFMIGYSKFQPVYTFTTDCVGPEPSEKNFLDYIQNLLKMAGNLSLPIFIHSWQTNLAHENINGVQVGDEDLVNFFEEIESAQNTLVFFLSDHGYRFGKIRNTFVGWLEDKLPLFYVHLSPDLREKYPNWVENLQYNSRRLTSPYDLYQTLTDILNLTSNFTLVSANLPNGQPYNRTYGQSLISTKISENRKCSDAGIPEGYCACFIPQEIGLDDDKLKSSANSALQHINGLLPAGKCADLKLDRIIAGAIMGTDVELGTVTYTVSFTTIPGQFHFEANILHVKSNGTFAVTTQILRMNKINTDVSCIQNSLHELYCFCL